MLKVYLKRKTEQEALSLNTDRYIIVQPDKLPIQGIKNN